MLEQILEMLARNEKAVNRLCDLIEGGYVAIPTPVTLEQTLGAPAVTAVEAKIEAPVAETPVITAVSKIAKATPVETKAPASVEKTLDDVKNALNSLLKARGKDAVVASLAKFGVAKLTELSPAQYNAVIAELSGARGDE